MGFAAKIQDSASGTATSLSVADIAADLQSAANSTWHYTSNRNDPEGLKHIGAHVKALLAHSIPSLTLAEKQALAVASFGINFGSSGMTVGGERCPNIAYDAQGNAKRDAAGNLITEPYRDTVTFSIADYSKYSHTTDAELATRMSMFAKLETALAGARIDGPAMNDNTNNDRSIRFCAPLASVQALFSTHPLSAREASALTQSSAQQAR